VLRPGVDDDRDTADSIAASVVRGRLAFHLKCRPAFDYARAAHECHLDAHGARFEGPRLSLRLAAPIALRPDCAGVVADFTLGASQIVTAAAFVMASFAKPSGQPMNGVSQTQDHSPRCNPARFGRIDRRIREVTSRLDALCRLVTIDS
jgi:hypothetical protein